MGKYGKYASDGSVEAEATECILTGRALNPPYDNTVRYPARGGQFFRILSSQHHRVTDDMMADWKAGDTPAVETFAVVEETGGKKKKGWSVEPVVGGDSDAGSESGQ